VEETANSPHLLLSVITKRFGDDSSDISCSILMRCDKNIFPNYQGCYIMITQKELVEILRESPLYKWMDDFDLLIIVKSLHEHIATQN